ncbi:hypothetical protein F2Q69_00008996 [Brassica cretica]|uniref:Uncharacterized protein n=1 Tax=Brassica cretica TaxID=69181 RepID=A0A8S9PIY5_BRACR|nr:hypothetical protein F2Q69_00008996 [Brassica cretica]
MNMETLHQRKRKRKRERKREDFLSGVRPARERPCRRRNPYSFSKRFLFASSSSRLTDRFVGALDWNHPLTVVSSRGGKTRLRGGSQREKRGLHVSVVILGDGGYHRSVDAGLFSGRWRLFQLRRRRF